jgi:hypothetical protein
MFCSSLTGQNVYQAVNPAGSIGCEYCPPMFYDVSLLIATNPTRQLFLPTRSRRYRAIWHPEICIDNPSRNTIKKSCVNPFRRVEKSHSGGDQVEGSWYGRDALGTRMLRLVVISLPVPTSVQSQLIEFHFVLLPEPTSTITVR